MIKYKLVIVADLDVPEGVKFSPAKAAKALKKMYAEYLPEDLINIAPIESKVSKVGVSIETA